MTPIPANIVTGFLGAGKTSLITHLLRGKPPGARWAVLVNEFGAIGVDGMLLGAQAPAREAVEVLEVPGGCMCCVAAPLMGAALDRLLEGQPPDRLLIEPSGLGHPLEVVQVLQSQRYRSLVSLHRTLSVVDARQLSNPRYTEDPTFLQQIAIADVVVGNKADLYGPGEWEQLARFAALHAGPRVPLVSARHGVLDAALVEGETALMVEAAQEHELEAPEDRFAAIPIPPEGYLSAANRGDGFVSRGWRFSPTWVFDHDALFAFISGVAAERLKAVFTTERGIFAYNRANDQLMVAELDECLESRLEIIAAEADEGWHAALLACRRR